MSWLIRVGSAGFERSMNGGALASSQCLVTSTARHTIAQLNLASTSGLASPNAPCQAEQVWQNVLSTLVDID